MPPPHSPAFACFRVQVAIAFFMQIIVHFFIDFVPLASGTRLFLFWLGVAAGFRRLFLRLRFSETKGKPLILWVAPF